MQHILGTSMWGWTISQSTAFELLDTYYKAGGRQIDTATNYPINKNPKDWRRAEGILAEWITAHGIADLQIWVKVGSLDNQMSPQHNLRPSFLQLAIDYYQQLFSSNLHTFGIHWDNREMQSEIATTFETLQRIHSAGYHLGCSGVRHPNLYASVNKHYNFSFRIQLKNSILQSDVAKYAHCSNNHQRFAYGINAGGLKLYADRYGRQSYLKTRGGNPQYVHPIIPLIRNLLSARRTSDLHPPITTFHQISLLYNYYQPEICGVLLGASCPAQLEDSLQFIASLGQYDYRDIYQQLIGIRKAIAKKIEK